MTVEAYIQTIPGREVTGRFLLHEKSIWGFWGELDDPSMFGNHVNPFLGIFEGTLHEAIKKALTVPRFNSWGGGGIIRPVTVFK